jgi:hypothetical protein
MKPIGSAAALAFILSIAGVTGLHAQSPQRVVPDLHARNIVVEYYEPRDAYYKAIYDRLQERKVLEELGQFLAPVNWPRTLRLIAKQCPPGRGIFYNYDEYSLIVCYDFFKMLKKITDEASKKYPSFATPQEVIVGGLVGIVLHEAGLAAFDMLGTPLLGSDQDAGDQIASLMGLQFGPQVARTVIKGTYLFWTWQRDQNTSQTFNLASSSSVEPQRAFNALCIAYGSPQSATFKDLVDKGLLTNARAGNCVDEYKQAAEAFVKTIQPHINQELMRKALAMCSSSGTESTCWIESEDLK